jgi:hypothetical protein
MLNLKNLKQTGLLLILSVVLDFSYFSQINLVPNPGFEIFDTCPNIVINEYSGLSQICFASPWFQPNYPNDTSGICGRSISEYFHSCAEEIPYVLGGFQFPNNGSGFSAIVTLWPNINEDIALEYLEIKLNEYLKNDKRYCVSWYSNLADVSMAAHNRVGAHFSTDTLFQFGSWDRIPVIPQIENSAMVTDTQKWVPFHQSFIAEGGERFMTVGNFYSKANVEYQILSNLSAWAYYYFDDFGVYELPEISAGLGGEIDTLGENVSLQASCEGCWNDLVYRWWPSAGLSDTTILNPNATPEVTTTYYFGLIDTSETVPCIVDLVDSVTVFVTIPQDTITPPPTSFSWLVYPSPTNGNLTVQFSALAFDSQLLIIDARGRLVRKIAVPKNTESLPLDISSLAAGEYFLQVENEGLKEKRKVVKF